MGKRTIWVCDRCDEQRENIQTSSKWSKVREGPQDDGRPNKRSYLLCPSCKDEFLDFMGDS